jgi:hypothetical protein
MAKLVGHTGDKRRFRPDHDQVDLVLAAEREQPFAVFGSDRMALADLCDSGVPGCGVQFLALLALSELPGQGMLAPTRPRHQNLHATSVSKGSAMRISLTWPKLGRRRQRKVERLAC